MPHFLTKKNLRFVFFPSAKCIEVLIQYFLPQYTVQLQIWLIVVQISIGHILLLLYALFKCWTCSDPCWICKKIFATRCLAYDQPNELFFYINIFTLISYSPKPLLSSRDVNRIPTKLKLLTGTYILQNNRAKYKNYTIDPTCLLCDSEAETPAHFILNCPALSSIRNPITAELQYTV